jgi:hemoglobin-like flavoprotein
MTLQEIALVQLAFQQIAPRAEQVGFAIYERIFELDPSSRALFREDMRPQVKRFVAALSTVVGSLDNLTPILESIRSLGRRHASYGVEPRHFELGGIALLATLEAELGNAYTPEMRAAWTRAYDILAGAMVSAMTETKSLAA